MSTSENENTAAPLGEEIIGAEEDEEFYKSLDRGEGRECSSQPERGSGNGDSSQYHKGCQRNETENCADQNVIVLSPQSEVATRSEDFCEVSINAVFESHQEERELSTEKSEGRSEEESAAEKGDEEDMVIEQCDYESAKQRKSFSCEHLVSLGNEKEGKVVCVQKRKGETLGIQVTDNSWSAGIPGVFISHVYPGSPCARNGLLNVGDVVLEVAGTNVVGLPHDSIVKVFADCNKKETVNLRVLPSSPVIEVTLRRNSRDKRLGLDILDGEIKGIDRHGVAVHSGLSVGQRLIAINGISVVGLPHEQIVQLLLAAGNDVKIKAMASHVYHAIVDTQKH
eukprot:Nk52_evm35s229 gene=Nk52_evmTU35s229